jgi:saccharopine dehydrogenase (NAD+, L-lysine forming)
MLHIGIIKEGKVPADNRVALTPAQCRFLLMHFDDVQITVEPSNNRCFSDKEYARAGVKMSSDFTDCDLLLGIKEVPIEQLIPNKKYMFFSHTKKAQAHNQKLMQAMVEKRITLIDYECLEHEDGQRILGFGFFAGVVGAHNGILAYGNRSKRFQLGRVYDSKNMRDLVHTYFHLKLPNLKIALTGSGRVASGLLEVMNLLGVIEVEPEEFVERDFSYPVFVQLKGANLYAHKETGKYNRNDFHAHPENYRSKFEDYLSHTDILLNGVYWDKNIPQLFTLAQMTSLDFRIQTIADVTDDVNGSVPCNLGDSTIDSPVYGVDKMTHKKTEPYLPNSVDLMAVGNLPNELPRDASSYFGEQLIKYVLDDIRTGGSKMIDNASILKDGKLTGPFAYLTDYAESI